MMIWPTAISATERLLLCVSLKTAMPQLLFQQIAAQRSACGFNFEPGGGQTRLRYAADVFEK